MDLKSIESDDFYVNLNLNVSRDLLLAPETVHRYFDRMKLVIPGLGNVTPRDNGELVCEGDSEQKSYPWIAIESRRVCCGLINPGTIEETYSPHEAVLKIAPDLFAIGDGECDAIDVMYGFDFTCPRDQDAVVADALGLGPGLKNLLHFPGSRVINFEPSVTIALDESNRLQARIVVETRSTLDPARSADGDDQLSVYVHVRQHWGAEPGLSFVDAYRRVRGRGELLLASAVIPDIVNPLARVIRK